MGIKKKMFSRRKSSSRLRKNQIRSDLYDYYPQQQDDYDPNHEEAETYYDDDDNVEVEERGGYSIRGLEMETPSARRMRDDIYFEAKCVVLSMQDELAAR